MFEEVQKWFCMRKDSKAEAVLRKSGEKHEVRLQAIRVLLCEDRDGFWFAQCIDIDYAATGTSADDAKRRFEIGLKATVDQHIHQFGSLDRLLKAPPLEDWLSLVSALAPAARSSSKAQSPLGCVEYIEGARHAA